MEKANTAGRKGLLCLVNVEVGACTGVMEEDMY